MRRPPLRPALALAALLALARAAGAGETAEQLPSPVPAVSAVPQVVSLLQLSLQQPAGLGAGAAPLPVDARKAAAFLERAQAVQHAAAAHPISIPSLPSSAVLDPNAPAPGSQVPPEARPVVLGAVGAALDGLSDADIQNMSPEDVARMARRIFEEVGGSVERPPTVGEDVMARLRSLSVQARARMGRYLGQAYDLVHGSGGAPVGKGASAISAIHCLQREPSDYMPSHPAAAKEPLAHEIMRLLDDSDGPDGFNHFIVTIALDAYIEAEASGRLKTGERQVDLVDPRDGTTLHDVSIRGMPVVSEEELEVILDRRLRAYGLDARRLNLEGPRVPVSRFVDALQHLYLADRLANARLNGFRGDVLPAFLISREPLASARRAMAERRSPCSPLHVQNLLRVLFDIP